MKWGVIIFWALLVSVAVLRIVFDGGDPLTIGPCLKSPVHGHGIVSTDPSRTESGQVIIVRASELYLATTTTGLSLCATDLSIRVKAKPYPRFFFGDEVTFSGRISAPFNFKNDTGRSFDYIGYLAKDDIYYEIKSAEMTRRVSPEGGDRSAWYGEVIESVGSILFRIKRRFVGNVEGALGEPHAALAAGLVVGEKSALGKDLLDDFRLVGLIHIVVLSGFNITIVGDALRRALSFLPRVWGISIGGLGIILFGVMVGGGATVVRSCFMASIALSADLIRRDYSVMRALVFAGLVMIIHHPAILLHDPSFQLSFLATLGLITLAGPIEERFTFITARLGLRGIVASTIATQIFVSPYILYTMGSVSIVSMAANILVLPIIPVTMLFVFLTGAAGFVSTSVAAVFGWVSHLLLSYELHIVEWFARLPFASATLPEFSGWWVVGVYGVIIFTYVGAFIAKEKYLKRLKILWRTASLK